MAVLGEINKNTHVGPTISRSESFGSGHYYLEQSNMSTGYGYNNNTNYTMMEKRQLFLRSYQFCRKQTLSERIKRSLVRVKRVIFLRLKSARRFRKLACFRIRCGFFYRRRRFIRLLNSHNNNNCLW